MQVYNAVIISQLVYGLETMYLNDSLIKRLDAFHVRGIRHIRGIEHSYWSRTSNEEILAKANALTTKSENIIENWREFITPNNEGNKNIRLVSEILEETKRC